MANFPYSATHILFRELSLEGGGATHAIHKACRCGVCEKHLTRDSLNGGLAKTTTAAYFSKIVLVMSGPDKGKGLSRGFLFFIGHLLSVYYGTYCVFGNMLDEFSHFICSVLCVNNNNNLLYVPFCTLNNLSLSKTCLSVCLCVKIRKPISYTIYERSDRSTSTNLQQQRSSSSH